MAEDRDVLTRPAEPGITISYGEHEDQVVEVFPPRGEPRATVLAIHGGFWRHEYDRAHLRPFCRALNDAGYGVVSLEYRRTGGGGGWPETLHDIESAVHELDDQLLYYDLAGDIILTGHSAGAHLALCATTLDWGDHDPQAQDATDTDPFFVEPLPGPRPGPLSGVVALAPITDLARCHALNLDDGAAEAFMGGGPDDVPEEYVLADPAGFEERTYFELTVPVTVVHGDADDRVPVAMSRDYAIRDRVELRELRGVGHFELIDPLSSAWPIVLAAFEDIASG
ncbi:MAG: alpha/beta hydrolase family protein [Stackebrandtia sp.]